MNLIKLSLILAFFCVVSFSAQAQNVKPKFKELILIGYYANAMYERGPHIIDYTIQITGNDTVSYTANNFDHKTHTYGMSDTIYRVPDSLVRELNKIFNGKRALKSHMITNKLKNGDSTYSDHIYFVKYIGANNTSDSFIAVQPFLDDQFSKLIDKVASIPRGKRWSNRKIYHDAEMENMVLDEQKKCDYIPKPEPPRVSKLEVADPGVKH